MKYLLCILLTAYCLLPIAIAQTLGNTDLYLVRGDAKEFEFSFYGDVTADELLFVVKASDSISDLRLIQKKNTVAGGSQDEIVTTYKKPFTKIKVKFIPIDTEDLLRNRYYFDLTRTNPADSTDHTHLFIGYLNMQPTISTPGDGSNVPLDGTRFYFVGLDSSNKEPGIPIFRNSDNSMEYLSYEELLDSTSSPDSFDVHRTKLNNLSRKTSHIIKIEEYIGALDTSLGWSLVIQAAVDANLNTGTSLIFKENYLYELQNQKQNPYNPTLDVCVDLKTGGVSLIIPSSTVIMMKDGQQTDAGGAVDLIAFEDASNIYIGGGGKIIGNTAGQTGWTQGYGQLQHGCIIRGYSTGNDWGLGHNIIIENLELSDHFSNPLDISAVEHLIYKDLRAYNVGEGFGASFCNDVYFDNILLNDSSSTMAGDAIEVVRVYNFKLVNCTVEETYSGASAFDLGGSWNGIVDNFRINNWYSGGGFSFGTSMGYICDNIIIQNGACTNDTLNTANSAIALESGEGEITFKNVTVKNYPQGFAALDLGDGVSGGLQRVENCTFINTRTSVLSSRIVWFNNCVFDSCGNTVNNGAIDIYAIYDNDTSYTRITDCKFYNSDGYGIRTDVNAKSGFVPIGNITNCYFENNTNSDIYFVSGVEFHTSGNKRKEPQLFNQAGGSGALTAAGIDLELYITGNYPYHTISNYSPNQKIDIRYILSSGNYAWLYDKDDYGSGNIDLSDNLNRIMSDGDFISLVYDSSTSSWREIAFHDQLAGKDIQTIDGWYQDNVPANQTTVNLLRGSSLTSQRFYITRDCFIRAVGVYSNEARTAGTLTVYLNANGGGYFTAVLDGTNTQYSFTRSPRYDGYLISAGSYLSITITTTADWAPETADIIGFIEVEY